MVKFHNSDLWIAWMVIFCMEGSRFDLHTGKVCVRALDVTVSQSSIQVARGQAAILPCSFTTSAALNNLNIIWMVIPLSNANQPEQVIIYQGGQVFSLANHLHGRVGFVATMPSTSASIFINNTQLSDTGTYQCLVNNLPDRGGRNIGVIGLTVLVPPSVPACRIQGTLDVGSDVMLICSSEEGIPTPSYSWEKLDALPKLPHNAMQGITNKLAVGVPFCPTFAGKSHNSVALTPIPPSPSRHHVPGLKPPPAQRFPSSDPAEG